MTENNTQEANQGCRWVKFDEYGNPKICENITAWYTLNELHPGIPDTGIDSMFNRIYCAPCLEGQKIQQSNRILSTIYNQTKDPDFMGEIVALIIEKLRARR